MQRKRDSMHMKNRTSYARSSTLCFGSQIKWVSIFIFVRLKDNFLPTQFLTF